MISLHGPDGPIALDGRADETVPAQAVWIDLADPSVEEARRVEAGTGLRVPSRAALSEVESSSRLRRLKGGGLSLSTPMVSLDRADLGLTPLGFVLDRDRLVTVRFERVRAYETVAARIAERDAEGRTSLAVFLALLEELVDGLADRLEAMSADLGGLSTRIFDFDVAARPGTRANEAQAPKRRDLALRRLLRAIGRQGKALSRVRASLLGLGRIVSFVKEGCDGAFGLDDAEAQFDVLARDIASLDEFESRQSETLQFLLDATLGLINIEQNSTFRVLTVVSVVGVPPTLIASIYGMNFKAMPELDWTYGYPMGLALILMSALVPAVLFRLRGWW